MFGWATSKVTSRQTSVRKEYTRKHKWEINDGVLFWETHRNFWNLPYRNKGTVCKQVCTVRVRTHCRRSPKYGLLIHMVVCYFCTVEKTFSNENNNLYEKKCKTARITFCYCFEW